jgi:uncharacterized protein
MNAAKSNRGFASMDKNKQKAIASKGGKAAHEKGTAHSFTTEEAKEAGKKGGAAVSKNREHMAEIGRKGGLNRGKKHGRTRVAKQVSEDVQAPAPVVSSADAFDDEFESNDE